MQDYVVNKEPKKFLENKSKKYLNKILRLQFVPNCSNAKKLICYVEQYCGFFYYYLFLKFYNINSHYCCECLKKFVLVGSNSNVIENYQNCEQVNVVF